MSSPRVEALAYRIWAYAEPMEWNVTSRDIADALGVSAISVGKIARRKGWLNRLRGDNGPIHGTITPLRLRDDDAYSDMDDQFGSTALSV